MIPVAVLPLKSSLHELSDAVLAQWAYTLQNMLDELTLSLLSFIFVQLTLNLMDQPISI